MGKRINRSTADLLRQIDTTPSHWPDYWALRGHKPSIVSRASADGLFGTGRTTGRTMLSPKGKEMLAEFDAAVDVAA